jgi:Bacteriophage minor capsid protein
VNPTLALARHLASVGVGTFDEAGAAGTIYADALPADPVEALAVIPTGGNPLSGALSLPYDEPTYQLMCRAASARRARETAQAAYGELQGFAGVMDPGGEALYVVRCQSMQTAPAYVGTDAAGHHRYAVNVAVQHRAPTAHRPE